MKYVLAIDQSTQGTKVLLVGADGKIKAFRSKAHKQIVDANGYISHDTEEIYKNVLQLVKEATAGTDEEDIEAVGITNQRETTVLFNSEKALAPAVVWQCARGKEIVDGLTEFADEIYFKTGLPLSPYFPAAKMAWLITHCNPDGKYMLGTVDSFLVYRLTGNFYTDFSNASRTQLLNIHTLEWDKRLCELFGVPAHALPEIKDSDSLFGYTDFDGIFKRKIPVKGVLGDSHAALYAHRCFNKGDVKATYGTGSSVMMNVGENCIQSLHGLSTSLAWKINGKSDYVLEGNINYSAAVISWLINDLGINVKLSELSNLAKNANPADTTVLVPAFSGLSAPYWISNAKAALIGMTRLTGKNEVIRAALDSIALQINDVLKAMYSDSGFEISHLSADGGASVNDYLMQIQSDMSKTDVTVSDTVEYSALGVAALAGKCIDVKILEENVRTYRCSMGESERKTKIKTWELILCALKSGSL